MQKQLLACLLLAICSGAAYAGIDISQLNANDIQSQLPPELANTNLTMEDAKTLIREKCTKIAGVEKGVEAYNEIETGAVQLSECAQKIINYTALQAEIEEASPRGELDVVFNKYCTRQPEALSCMEEFNVKLVPCLDTEERESQEVFMRIVRRLLSFVCHKGGDQIALFIAEKGPECLEQKKDDIQNCLNSTFKDYMPKEGLEAVKVLPKLVIGQQQCDEMMTLEKCIVARLETCDEITPANIVESMFRFIRNETICRTTRTAANAQKQAATGGSAASLLKYNFAVLALFLAAYYALSKSLQA